MTPAARLQAAIEILDSIRDGEPAEKALTTWGRRSRYAGSKDCAVVRDHVFTALRCRRSHAALGGSETGRGLILGALREAGVDPGTVFTGEGHAPQPLREDEAAAGRSPAAGAEAADFPDWLWDDFTRSLGEGAEGAAAALRQRAPVHLRVNRRKSTLANAQAALAEAGVQTLPHAAAPLALEVTEGPRKIRNSEPYLSGIVVLQDAASQAVTEALPLRKGMTVLDYCAGGGGKTLAIAAAEDVQISAHDIAGQRMRDLPERAKRAGVRVNLLEPGQPGAAASYDLVFCDAPCSGSGSWRRAPEGKWRLTAESLAELCATQAGILDQAAALVKPGGALTYATRSMLSCENRDQVNAFLARSPGWCLDTDQSWRVSEGTDGFYVAILTQTDRNT